MGAAAHAVCVPVRKTDVKDSEWVCQLVQHGLVRPSSVPPPEIRRLRNLTRLRKAQTNEHAPAALEGAPRRRDQALKHRVNHLLDIREHDARIAALRSHRS
jgi:transposase